MKACGLVVEYNPFHNGHLYHLTTAKKLADADCMIAVMSGNFLQRGEPAIIDKINRTTAALNAGVDIVIELPYAYAVQHSTLFAEGAIQSLHHLGVSAVCFGSETGTPKPFLDAVAYMENHETTYQETLKQYLDMGDSFPHASSKAYKQIGLHQLDLYKPNNILGLSYVQAIQKYHYDIEVFTTKRIQNDYHDKWIEHAIASATSIRKEIHSNGFSNKAIQAIPESTLHSFSAYKNKAGILHHWELYFPFLLHRIITSNEGELRLIHGIDEGLEFRLKKTCHQAKSFMHWLELMKSKRYTQTRLQRMFVHILTNTTKQEINDYHQLPHIPYIRLLGLSHTGRTYLNQQKKHLEIPLYSNLNLKNKQALAMDERASNVYYLAINSERREKVRKQEFSLPIML